MTGSVSGGPAEEPAGPAAWPSMGQRITGPTGSAVGNGSEATNEKSLFPIVDLGAVEKVDQGRSVSGLPVVHVDPYAQSDKPQLIDETNRCETILTVVICAHNDHRQMARTARSLAAQEIPDGVQILLADGASNDATVETAQAYLPDLVVASQFDGGIYPAMNRALSLAEGEYVYFLSCGDVLNGPSVLARLVGELRALPRPVPLIVCRVRHLDGARGVPFVTETIPFSLARMLAGRQDYSHQALVFHRGTALAAGGFPVGYGVVGDYHLILRLALIRPPTTREIVIADQDGGIGAADPRMVARLQAAVRQDVLDLRGPLRVLNRLYGETRLQRPRRVQRG